MPLKIGKVDRGEAADSLNKAIEKLADLRIKNKTTEKLDRFNNAVFCFTGKMKETRADIIRIVTDLNGVAQFNMSKTTNILVNANDTGTTTEKIRKARARGIPVINENQFWELVKTVQANGR